MMLVLEELWEWNVKGSVALYDGPAALNSLSFFFFQHHHPISTATTTPFLLLSTSPYHNPPKTSGLQRNAS